MPLDVVAYCYVTNGPLTILDPPIVRHATPVSIVVNSVLIDELRVEGGVARTDYTKSWSLVPWEMNDV